MYVLLKTVCLMVYNVLAILAAVLTFVALVIMVPLLLFLAIVETDTEDGFKKVADLIEDGL
ncbi:hypothetical protein IMZ31_24100 (plasmid) [Pontibacillus sp. ALD_SL1]|uniref:hypothetical protein n=1 Tax=Pontibacillus sp. ALD_SL1 TaxID=2777185 RepID=UPI001A96BD1C|nr:hypothetical protein [Pontibacillus sp. ALD_SL1]QST02535.1 hypothetical protein IMZ31_24100 [Pontibacillus sp. ALD_SL1]